MKITQLLRTLGPGLLWAGAAIGVSHLVQSTRAGANFGFQLVWLILLTNLVKYPFFEFAPRYAAATGKNLLQGYAGLGKWAIPLYLLLTWLTMFTLVAAVSVVTGSLFAHVFGLLNTLHWTYLLLIVGVVVVVVGNYKMLDKLIKFIILVLTLSAVVAVVFAAGKGFQPKAEYIRPFSWSGDIAFLIALAGWMPSAVDISVWHSVWTIAKKDSTGYAPRVREALFDFNVGYIGTAILSICFLSLGALVMYGSGNAFSPKGAVFAGQLIELFTSNLGPWSYPLIAVAALTTMVSTTLTVLDAFPRVLSEACLEALPTLRQNQRGQAIQWFWMAILIVGASLILAFFMSSMKLFIDIATILSFLTAPVLGWMNLRVVCSAEVPQEHQPPKWLRYLSYFGLVVLTSFGILYLIWLIKQ